MDLIIIEYNIKCMKYYSNNSNEDDKKKITYDDYYKININNYNYIKKRLVKITNDDIEKLKKKIIPMTLLNIYHIL